jgi:hypothetical protein
MPRFLIEVPHESTGDACVKAIDVILRTGSHFFSKADWGCKDGEHKAWIIVDVSSKDEARGIVPVSFRNDAKIVQLNAFSQEEITDALRQHKS